MKFRKRGLFIQADQFKLDNWLDSSKEQPVLVKYDEKKDEWYVEAKPDARRLILHDMDWMIHDGQGGVSLVMDPESFDLEWENRGAGVLQTTATKKRT